MREHKWDDWRRFKTCLSCGDKYDAAEEREPPPPCDPPEGLYPGCFTPFDCVRTGRCPRDPVCFN